MTLARLRRCGRILWVLYALAATCRHGAVAEPAPCLNLRGDMEASARLRIIHDDQGVILALHRASYALDGMSLSVYEEGVSPRPAPLGGPIYDGVVALGQHTLLVYLEYRVRHLTPWGSDY